MIVAIDGPAGSGKSTVAHALAARLGFRYLDTGAMYRCVALAAIRRWGAQPPPEPERLRWEAALGPLAARLRIELPSEASVSPAFLDRDPADPADPADRADPAHSAAGAAASGTVLLDGADVTAEIRTSEVAETASAVAAVPAVRAALVAKQRELLAAGGWVAEGRDVGTVVAPHAELKIFLTADATERARRRSAELGADERTVLAEQAIRDARDTAREHSPLQAAADAIELDTTGLSIGAVVERIAALAVQRSARP